ncbi:MAG TPA: FtsQ-type POTRA domain-containing protein [Thermoleophilaceae bacterium]|nr:FtsQ-type POTRA domain-containing protein [Thermoleophilaceae bacterium]
MSALQAALARPLDIALNVSPRMRRRALAGVAAFLALLALYMVVLRNCPLVKVSRVTVTGVTTSDASKLRQALTATGRSMTTLHVDQGRLDRVVSGYPVVRELRVSTDFPHGLRIEVVENEPAAVAVAGGSRVPVAADGTVLRGLPAPPGLAQLQLKGALPPERLTEPAALKAARVLGTAPLALRTHLVGLGQDGDRGLTVKMRQGPLLIFGDTTRLRAKWIAATRVLADRSSRGATYIDLRLPDRPAAGGVAAATLQPVAPTDRPATTTDQPAPATDQTAAPQAQATTTPTTSTPAPAPQAQPQAQPQPTQPPTANTQP